MACCPRSGRIPPQARARPAGVRDCPGRRAPSSPVPASVPSSVRRRPTRLSTIWVRTNPSSPMVSSTKALSRSRNSGNVGPRAIGEPCRVFMASEPEQQVRALDQSMVEIEPGNAPGRALADAVLYADQRRGTVEFLDDARSHDADHAGMPVRRSKDEGTRCCQVVLLAEVRLLRPGCPLPLPDAPG